MRNLYRNIILILLIICSTFAHSQSDRRWPDTLNLTVPFYFEDGVGNKDTVYLGFSDLATAKINTELGEIDLTNEPFDSSFEVRLAEFNRRYVPQFGIKYSGKVGYSSRVFDFRTEMIPCINYTLTRPFDFVINVNHFPIKIS